ncbi:MAG: chlorohydrolase family protein [Candidatus Kaistia colombiensis]|nr:MAG: chlorohydrolase family protein [Kaistia sp.]
MTTLLVKARYVVGYADGDHVILRDGEVVVDGNRITFVGRGYAGQVDRVIDGGDAILSPGFIDLDALADIDHAILDTWHGPETGSGLSWSADYFYNRRRDVFSAEDRDFKHAFAFTHLLRNGITTAMPIEAETHNAWAETYDEMAIAAATASDLGLRIYLGPSYRAGINVTEADGRHTVLFDEAEGWRGLAEAVRFVENFSPEADGLVRGALLPCRIETLTPELMRATASEARRLNAKVRLHCLQDLSELEFLRERYGKSPLDMLEETGLLEADLLIPHATYVGGHSRNPNGDRGDLARLAKSGISIIHCPMTSLRYGVTLESFARYRAAGVNIALGTDSFPPDMIRNMDVGVHLSKVVEGRQDGGSAADLFRAATLGGAAALGRDDLGRLAPGACADMVLVSLKEPRIGAIEDPIRTLLMNCTGANVTTVIIDGRVVMENGVIPGIDEEAMRQRAQTYFDTMKAAYSERDYRRRPVEQLFPPEFPEG